MNKHDLNQLSPVIELKFQAAQRSLAQHRETVRGLQQQLTDLDTARDSSQAERPEGDDPATAAGANVLWQRWIDQRRKDINLELARLAAEKPALMDQLKRSFGKKEALKQLLIASLEEEKLKQSRQLF